MFNATGFRDAIFETIPANRAKYLAFRRASGREIAPIDNIPEEFTTAERCFRDLSEADKWKVLRGLSS